MAARRRHRRALYLAVPRAPDLHDGGSAQHHLLHPSSVRGEEHRADRRPHHQHRRDRPLSRHGREPRRRAPEERPLEFRDHRSRDLTEDGGPMAMRIMIAEDEESLTTLLRYNLEAEGYEVEVVARGDEAELRLREQVPDLVLLDWMLPGLSGIELCRRIRVRPETERLPVIMLTARGEEGDRIRGLSTGADDYIVKPFSVPELPAR